MRTSQAWSLELAVLAIVTTMALAPRGIAEEPSKAPIYSGADEVESLVVHITNDRIEGAGILFHVDESHLYGITARHVLMSSRNRDHENLQMQTRLWSRRLPVETYRVDVLRDFAAFRAPIGELGLSAAQLRGALRFNVLGDVDRLERGDTIMPIGHASSGAWIIPTEPAGFAGSIRLTGQDEVDGLQFEYRCEIGHSGGGVFDGSWALVGMMVQQSPPYCKALRIDWILARLQDWKLEVSWQPAPSTDDGTISKPKEIVVSIVDFDNRTGTRMPGIGSLAHDILTTYLYDLPRVKLVTRERRQILLDEQQLTGVQVNAPRSAASLVETGQMLRADAVVTGSVIRYDVERRNLRLDRRFGHASATVDVHRMAISLQVVDVNSGIVRFSKTYDVDQRREYSQAGSAPRQPIAEQSGLLKQLVEKAGVDLRGALREVAAGLVHAGQLVRVQISSAPAGAEILVDGIYLGTTPMTIDRRVGLTEIEMSVPGHRVWRRRVRIEPGQSDIHAQLTPIARVPPP